MRNTCMPVGDIGAPTTRTGTTNDSFPLPGAMGGIFISIEPPVLRAEAEAEARLRARALLRSTPAAAPPAANR